MNQDNGKAVLGVWRSLVYRLYVAAKKIGLMRLSLVQYIAAKVYDQIRPRGELCVHVEGNTLYLKPEDRTITPVLVANEAYEKCETSLCKQFIKPGMTVIDIGANIGYYSLLFAKCVGSTGKVIAFEPEPGNFRFLEKNIASNPFTWVHPYNLALSDRAGTMDLYVGEISQTTSSFIKENILYEENVDRVPVKTVSLDAFLKEKNIKHVDFIKIDVQGAEEAVFLGAEELLCSPSLAMIMEFWPYGLQKAGTDIKSFLGKMERFGFSFYVLDEKDCGIHRTEPLSLLSDLNFDDRYFINLFLKKG